LCVDVVNGNDADGCRTGVGLPVGWLNEKFRRCADGKLPKENRGIFVDDGLEKGELEVSVVDGLVD
jgi:hypothetical protein